MSGHVVKQVIQPISRGVQHLSIPLTVASGRGCSPTAAFNSPFETPANEVQAFDLA